MLGPNSEFPFPAAAIGGTKSEREVCYNGQPKDSPNAMTTSFALPQSMKRVLSVLFFSSCISSFFSVALPNVGLKTALSHVNFEENIDLSIKLEGKTNLQFSMFLT